MAFVSGPASLQSGVVSVKLGVVGCGAEFVHPPEGRGHLNRGTTGELACNAGSRCTAVRVGESARPSSVACTRASHGRYAHDMVHGVIHTWSVHYILCSRSSGLRCGATDHLHEASAVCRLQRQQTKACETEELAAATREYTAQRCSTCLHDWEKETGSWMVRVR